MKRAAPVGAIAAACVLLPQAASAHLASTGLGPVYDGIYHFALTPEQFLPMAAFSLFAGLRGPRHARFALFALPVAWLAACLSGFVFDANQAAIVSATSVLACGALLAANIAVPPPITAAAAIALGASLGLAYGLPTGAGGPAVIGALGAALGIFVLFALLASVSLPLRRAVPIIAVRVAGSWTAALGLLLLGWWVHNRA